MEVSILKQPPESGSALSDSSATTNNNKLQVERHLVASSPYSISAATTDPTASYSEQNALAPSSKQKTPFVTTGTSPPLQQQHSEQDHDQDPRMLLTPNTTDVVNLQNMNIAVELEKRTGHENEALEKIENNNCDTTLDSPSKGHTQEQQEREKEEEGPAGSPLSCQELLSDSIDEQTSIVEEEKETLQQSETKKKEHEDEKLIVSNDELTLLQQASMKGKPAMDALEYHQQQKDDNNLMSCHSTVSGSSHEIQKEAGMKENGNQEVQKRYGEKVENTARSDDDSISTDKLVERKDNGSKVQHIKPKDVHKQDGGSFTIGEQDNEVDNATYPRSIDSGNP